MRRNLLLLFRVSQRIDEAAQQSWQDDFPLVVLSCTDSTRVRGDTAKARGRRPRHPAGLQGAAVPEILHRATNV